ncbi:MAG: phosphate ABC transporter substrate-binding/OmpA family protein [Planctomycetota bacterium]|jgi:ABC-type nitrate/sulfonate/bicarbonate transport system substrate-binding protein|nr:phosphate ABC transporter substrate-binding/OmpA family protein [Planctomycetota bacterium]MDA1201463.1 phosphate ABC transporter substrate-binding/OmpA family protein [Planctomycetota bacterium]
MSGQPKASFWVAVWLVVFALAGFAAWQWGLFGKPGQPGGDGNGGAAPGVAADGGQEGPAAGLEGLSEAPDESVPTTVQEYAFKPAERLPPVTGIAGYRKLEDDTVRFALNVWAGWAPIIYANEGFKPGKEWKTPDGKSFKLELVLIDNPVTMRDAWAAGEVHIGWATLDMVPLFLEGLVDATGKPKDSRAMPRIYQQVDFSNGGDGIVVREDIKTVRDLAGRKLVLAQNSPSQFFALNMLVAGGLQPGDVEMVYTDDAFQAAAAFNTDRSLAGCVSWAPDIYNLEQAKGNRMLVTTQTANRLIADVWFARADFAEDHPDKVEALVRGIFDAMEELKAEGAKAKAAELMADGYNIPATETLGMLADAHSTNWAENYQFFVNRNNPANFERIWKQAYRLYRRVGAITRPQVPFDQVMDFSVIQKLGEEPKYAESKDEYARTLAPKTLSAIRAENEEILTNTVVIHFYPNSDDLRKKIIRDVGGEKVEELYDPAVDLVLEEVATLAQQFGNARIIVEGHTDASMKGQAPADLVKELSLARATAVKNELIQQFEFDDNRFAVDGLGWDRPADPDRPDEHALNRRVEIKVYSAERE